MPEITLQKVLATLGVIFALLGTADFVPHAFWWGVVGLAAAAAGNAVTKYAGNAIFTVFGVVLAVVSAVTPSLAGIDELYGRIGMLVAAIVASLGRGLFGFPDDTENK